MLLFNQQGHLIPSIPIVANISLIRSVFLNNEHRTLLFERLELFLDVIKARVEDEIEVWINGSFVTTKPYPNDIDVVIFLPYTFFMEEEKWLIKRRNEEKPYLHIFFVSVYPQHHSSYILTQSDSIQWLYTFSTTIKKENKGFLKIIL
ncbi:MAG: hypothetical protein RLZZ292_269 [Bacteroidota bacterium]|jgi:hypothetical protein